MVYPALPGVPVVMELLDPGPGLATSVGRALATLHDLPPGLVEEVGLPSYTAPEYRQRLHSEVDDAGRTGYVTARLIDRWLGRLDQSELWLFQPVVIHGDMAPDHLLEEHGRVSAILDFSTVQVSDPAEDLAPLLAAASPEAAESILEAYRAGRRHLDDPHLAVRAELLAEIAVARWLLFGVRHDDDAIVADARSMLADLDKAVAEQEHQADLARLESERKAREAAWRHAAAERAGIRADRETAERRAIAEAIATTVLPAAEIAAAGGPGAGAGPGADGGSPGSPGTGSGDGPGADGGLATDGGSGGPANSTAGTAAGGEPNGSSAAEPPPAPESGPDEAPQSSPDEAEATPPVRVSASSGPIGVWPRRRRGIPTWDDAAASPPATPPGDTAQPSTPAETPPDASAEAPATTTAQPKTPAEDQSDAPAAIVQPTTPAEGLPADPPPPDPTDRPASQPD
jgi:thiamine kinase-like enzyme